MSSLVIFFWMITETSITHFYKYFILPIDCDEILNVSFIKYLKVQSLELTRSLHSTTSLKEQFRNLELQNENTRKINFLENIAIKVVFTLNH